ncbi:MAG: DUF302 domain-containing protein [Puia sp.]|nr:DUF302 domain-containing protein [Puia sp.]
MANPGFPGIPSVVSKQSHHTVKETVDRLQKILERKGVTIFARIDQQAEALKAGLSLSPIEILIFGNPRAGTPIMAAVPLAGLDLPLKALCWQDADNQVWLSYNDPAYIQQRFSLPEALVKPTDFGLLADLAVTD